MTYATYNLTNHTQLSIRGTTGTHPNSKFVFGIFIGGSEFGEELSMDDPSAYDDMDWSRAVEMANWILEQNEWIKKVKE